MSRSLSRQFLGYVFLADELRIGRRHLHGDVLHQALKIVRAGDEIGFAIDLHQHADLRAGMNVAADSSLPRGAGGFLRCRSDAVLSQNDFGFRQVALGFHQSLLALHHSRAGAVAKFLY